DAQQVGERGGPRLGQQAPVGLAGGGLDVAAGFAGLDDAHGVVPAGRAPGFHRRTGQQATVDRAGHGIGGAEEEGDQGVGAGLGRDAQARGHGGVHRRVDYSGAPGGYHGQTFATPAAMTDFAAVHAY